MSTLFETIKELGAGRLGETNLLLSLLTDGPRERQTVAKAVFGVSGATDQIPVPDLYMAVALAIGLILETEEGLSLTKLGEQVWKESAGIKDVFAPAQMHLVLPEIIGHPDLRQTIASALECFEHVPATDLYRLRESPLSNINALGLQILQTCKITDYQGDNIVARFLDLEFIKEILGPDRAMTDEEFQRSLDAANKRGKAAEEYVVDFEKARLVEEGRPELAELVKRVSATNARSPYDVSSYNSDASPRFIEVKSSITARLVFYWTDSERAFASSKRQSYWLYYIPRSQDLPHPKFGLTLIPDPMQNLGSELNEQPVSYRVTAKEARFANVGTIAGVDVRSFQLPAQ